MHSFKVMVCLVLLSSSALARHGGLRNWEVTRDSGLEDTDYELGSGGQQHEEAPGAFHQGPDSGSDEEGGPEHQRLHNAKERKERKAPMPYKEEPSKDLAYA